MRITRVEDLFAYECAVNFKEEVHRIGRASPEAYRDLKCRSQLWDAADAIDSDISEGFYRGNPGGNVNFLRYALASLAEARKRLLNGITRGYFGEADCKVALVWADRCKPATLGYLRSQQREAERRRKRKRGRGSR
jgi:four helix bundle protein